MMPSGQICLLVVDTDTGTDTDTTNIIQTDAGWNAGADADAWLPSTHTPIAIGRYPSSPHVATAVALLATPQVSVGQQH